MADVENAFQRHLIKLKKTQKIFLIGFASIGIIVTANLNFGLK